MSPPRRPAQARKAGRPPPRTKRGWRKRCASATQRWRRMAAPAKAWATRPAMSSWPTRHQDTFGGSAAVDVRVPEQHSSWSSVHSFGLHRGAAQVYGAPSSSRWSPIRGIRRFVHTVVNRSDRFTLAHFTRRPVGPVCTNWRKPFRPVHFSTLHTKTGRTRPCKLS